MNICSRNFYVVLFCQKGFSNETYLSYCIIKIEDTFIFIGYLRAIKVYKDFPPI